MSWFFLVGLLLYVMVGAVLVQRTMRGAEIQATFIEWVNLILLWPLCLKIFIHMSLMQSQFEAIKVRAKEDKLKVRD